MERLGATRLSNDSFRGRRTALPVRNASERIETD